MRYALTALALACLAPAAHADYFQVGIPADRASFFSAVGASADYTETFESVPIAKDGPVAAFTQAGITYTGLAGTPGPNVWVASPGYNNFGAGVGVTTSSVLTANGDEEFDITFATPVRIVATDVYLNGLGEATISFFNGANALTSASWLTSVDNIRFVGYQSDLPITRVHFVSTAGGQLNTGLDNFAVTAVPEPATWGLMGLGLLAVGHVARRRRS